MPPDSEMERRPLAGAPSEQSIAGERVDADILNDGAGVLNPDLPALNDVAEAEGDLRTFVSLIGVGPDQVREVRVLGYGGRDATASGYFADPEMLVRAVLAVPKKSRGIYITLNSLAAFPAGRTRSGIVEYPKTTTSDEEIARRSSVFVDVDPVRASNCAATTAEQAAAQSVADEIVQFLKCHGVEPAARVDTGNGQAIYLRTDLPGEDGGLVTCFLTALALRFDTAEAKVDCSVSNRARICRLPGTWNRKGEDTPERPHRPARLLDADLDAPVVSAEAINRVLATIPRAPNRDTAGALEGPKIDVGELLTRNGIQVHRESPWKDGHRWVLAVCPFNPAHTDKAAVIVQFASGAVAVRCHHNSCSDKGWREFNAGLAQPARRPPSDGSDASSVKPSPDSWQIPQPLPAGLPGVMAFDVGLLPGTLRDWATDVADRMQCPVDYIAATIVVILAAAIGKKVAIRPKREDDWTVHVNLWGLIVARPGMLKSPAIREGMRAMERLEIEAKKKFDADKKLHQLQDLAGEAAVKLAKDTITKRLKSGESQASAIQGVDFQECEPPTRKRYIVNDSTVEKLGELLKENTNGLLVFRDELLGLLMGLDREGQECARAFYLEAWDGGSRFTYDRIGRGTIDIPDAMLSVFGGIQPGPLHQYVLNASQEGLGDDGLLQRFQIAVWPDAPKTFVNVDREPNAAAREVVYDIVQILTELEPAGVGAAIDQANPFKTPFLRFTDEAQFAFDQWREKHETLIRSGSEHPALESHLAKYRSLLPSLALIFHIVDEGAERVSLTALKRAMGWLTYLESHARRLFAPLLDPDGAAARALAKKILERKVKDGFAARDVYTKGWSGLPTSDQVRLATQVLVDLEWIQESRSKTSGAPKTVYWINPRVYAAFNPEDLTALGTPVAAPIPVVPASAPPEVPASPPPQANEVPLNDEWGQL